MEKRVAVYNNNTGVVETMSSLLAGEGLKMVAVTGRAQLQELLRAQEVQLLLLDVELDGRGWGEGIEMIHDIRNMTTIPIIIISAQDAETAKIMALNAGADDYVTVGYNPLELLARVKSQLRRYTQLVNLERYYPSARSMSLSGICRPSVRIIPLRCISATSVRRSRAIPRNPDI